MRVPILFSFALAGCATGNAHDKPSALEVTAAMACGATHNQKCVDDIADRHEEHKREHAAEEAARMEEKLAEQRLEDEKRQRELAGKADDQRQFYCWQGVRDATGEAWSGCFFEPLECERSRANNADAVANMTPCLTYDSAACFIVADESGAKVPACYTSAGECRSDEAMVGATPESEAYSVVRPCFRWQR